MIFLGIKIFIVAENNAIDICHAGNALELMETSFKPWSPNSLAYWKLYTNSFTKLSKIAKRLSYIPTSSSSIERIFSELSQKVGKRSTDYKCETLCLLHQSSAKSSDFISALKENRSSAQ